ncbi:unnamed protein product [Phaeothamnion confervicola]
MQRFGLGSFAVTEPEGYKSAPQSFLDQTDGFGDEEPEPATVLHTSLAEELIMQELRTMNGTYLSISGFLPGTDAIGCLRRIPVIIDPVILRDASASSRLFLALDEALEANPFFAETVHLYIDLAWGLRKPRESIEKAVRIAQQSIEAGRSYDSSPSHRLQPPPPVSELLLLTLATHENRRLELLRRSAFAAGVRLQVFGLGEAWRGFGTKIVQAREALEGIADDTCVVYIDAFDTLLLPSAKDIVRRFLWLGADIVFGAEVRCGPDDGLRLLYPPHLAAGRAFLNAGTFAGRASDVRRMLEEIAEDLQRHHKAFGGDVLAVDDQRWFTRFFLRHAASGHAAVDAGRVLFLALNDLPRPDVVAPPGDSALLRYTPTDGSTCVLHGNGNGKGWLDVLTRDFGRAGWPPLPGGSSLTAAS